MKGIIYKIVCNETGECYYGSTTKTLNKRITEHKSTCKGWKLGKCNFTNYTKNKRESMTKYEEPN